MTRAGLPGDPARLLHRLRLVPVTVVELRRTAEDVLPGLASDDLDLGIVEDRVRGPVLTVEEDEHRVSVPLQDLAEDMTDARVAGTPAGIARALADWVAARPVPDRAAATSGIAVLDWRDRTETAVGWRVVVRRGAVVVPWIPSPGLDRRAAGRIRAEATERAGLVGGELRIEGPVAVWSHPEVPLLASAALVPSGGLPDRIAGAGLPVDDLHVVVTPHHPVACAAGPVAARLAGETGEPYVRLPWPALAGVGWV